MGITSEAQQLVDRLVTSGMQTGEIAKTIGVRAQTVWDIRRRKNSGNVHVDKLRVLAAGLGDAIPASLDAVDHKSIEKSNGLTSDDAPSSAQSSSSDTQHIATIQAEDAPKDERSTLDKAKDKIKSMLLGGDEPTFSAASAPARKSGGGIEAKRSLFVDQATPIIALAVTLGADLLIADPYKPVAPTEPEAAALVRPWIRIMARQLEIAGQLSETQLDIIAALGATALYGRRAHATYRSIRESEAAINGTTRTGAANGASASQAGYNGHNNGNGGAYRDAAGAIVTGGRGDSAVGRGSHVTVQATVRNAQAHDPSGGGPIDTRYLGPVRSGIDPIAELYVRDAEGRRQAGLD